MLYYKTLKREQHMTKAQIWKKLRADMVMVMAMGMEEWILMISSKCSSLEAAEAWEAAKVVVVEATIHLDFNDKECIY